MGDGCHGVLLFPQFPLNKLTELLRLDMAAAGFTEALTFALVRLQLTSIWLSVSLEFLNCILYDSLLESIKSRLLKLIDFEREILLLDIIQFPVKTNWECFFL